VITSLWDEWDGRPRSRLAEQNGIEHIAEAQWADALVVAPPRPTFWPNLRMALPTTF
jgi:phosphopantothenoylcysteine synthetase/decarboxylase